MLEKVLSSGKVGTTISHILEKVGTLVKVDTISGVVPLFSLYYLTYLFYSKRVSWDSMTELKRSFCTFR